jgi:2-hydroxychromene-2-carboxylate isomerase
MGQVVSLAHHRESHGGTAEPEARRWPVRAAFLFDLASPFTYLAAERAERLFTGLAWRPASERMVAGQETRVADALAQAREREEAERRAALLQLPLVWPENHPAVARRAMRVASLAVEQLRAAPFVMAASRLAFCGGFDLDDPETLAEAAAAAGLGLDEALAAARDERRDVRIEAEALRLRAAGGRQLPAFVIRGAVFEGERRVEDAAAAARAAAPLRRAPGEPG